METQATEGAAALLQRVRQILRPRMSELERIFAVPPQEIYRWAAGHSQPSDRNQALLQSMADAAGVFEAAGICRAGHLISMRMAGGRTLLDLIETGENTQHHLEMLIKEHRIQQAAYEASGIRKSRAPATDDWRAQYSIPGGPERE